jgi:hypothetical protein
LRITSALKQGKSIEVAAAATNALMADDPSASRWRELGLSGQIRSVGAYEVETKVTYHDEKKGVTGPFIPLERSKKRSCAARSHLNRCGSRCTRPGINRWGCRRNDRRAHPPDGRPLLPQMAVQRELPHRSRAGTSRTIGTLSLKKGRSA